MDDGSVEKDEDGRLSVFLDLGSIERSWAWNGDAL